MKLKGTIRPTTVFDHGMNPGLISHLAKIGLRNAYQYINASSSHDIPLTHESLSNIAEKSNLLAIHVAELDTQKLKKNIPFKTNTFYNTWSGAGMIAEGIDPIQVGHSKKHLITEYNFRTIDDLIGKKGYPASSNLKYYPIRGVDRSTNTLVLSDKGEEILSEGFLIPHGEANTLSKYLSTETYTPDVYYVYHPSDVTIRSIDILKKRKYHQQKYIHSVLDQTQLYHRGYDSVGAYLIFGEEVPFGWWIGTVLSVSDVKKMGLKYAGPTEVQVAISYLSCIKWMLENPREGICSPEDLPSEYILELCMPYLGKFYSRPTIKTPEIF